MTKFYFTIFLLFGNFLFCQQYSLPVVELLDVNYINKNGITIISSDSALRTLNISDENKKSISNLIDFNKNQLLYLSFSYSCPSMCKETFFEYFLKNENQSKVFYILIHSLGELAARKYRNVFFAIPNTVSLVGLKVDEQYSEYAFHTKNQLDSICNNLYKKFNK